MMAFEGAFERGFRAGSQRNRGFLARMQGSDVLLAEVFGNEAQAIFDSVPSIDNLLLEV